VDPLAAFQAHDLAAGIHFVGTPVPAIAEVLMDFYLIIGARINEPGEPKRSSATKMLRMEVNT
jgi:hypothetical protein